MGLISSETLDSLAQGGFYILLLIFTIQTVFLAYHWFTFGSSKQMSLLALAIYLGGGAILFITLSIALNTL